MQYQKHNLYTGEYDLTDHGVCTPPDDSEWTVLAVVGEHEEGGQFTAIEGEAENICLVLQDAEFWPVLSFITHTEARLLAHALLEAVGQEHQT
jgi:hypothetical protein